MAQARKDPGVMETAMCHVVLLDALVGSGLLDRCNHTQRGKFMMVCWGGERKDLCVLLGIVSMFGGVCGTSTATFAACRCAKG